MLLSVEVSRGKTGSNRTYVMRRVFPNSDQISNARHVHFTVVSEPFHLSCTLFCYRFNLKWNTFSFLAISFYITSHNGQSKNNNFCYINQSLLWDCRWILFTFIILEVSLDLDGSLPVTVIYQFTFHNLSISRQIWLRDLWQLTSVQWTH